MADLLINVSLYEWFIIIVFNCSKIKVGTYFI